jgi:glycosyltransferase involved in cell wall biosynthesis
MRIAINAAFLGGREEGLATYARSAIGHLAHSGHEIFVYTSDRGNINGNGNSPVNWRRTPVALRAASGSLGNMLRAIPWTQTVLPLRLLRDHAQVLLCTLPEGMLAPVCPQVVVVHDVFPMFFPELYPRWRHYFRHFLPRVLKASSSVIADSEHTKDDLMRVLGVAEDKIEVIYPWIDPLYFSDDSGTAPEGHEAAPYFLFVGRSSPHKNLEAVIRAFAMVSPHVDHKLICVLGFSAAGDREYCSQMLKLAEELGVRERLQIHTGLARSQVLFLYRHATALLLLSKYEGFGYPPLEAMAIGTPTIVSDSTSLAEVSGPAAACVANNNPELAAEAMLRIATDADYKRSLTDRGRLHARKFSMAETSHRIQSVLERCGRRG